MLGLELTSQLIEGAGGEMDSLPEGWVGARHLAGLLLHLREFGTEPRGPIGELAEGLFAIDDESRALIEAERLRYFEVAASGAAPVGEAVWKVARTFLDELFCALSDLLLRDCYAANGGLLSEGGRAELFVRTLRAGAGVVAWDAFRYGPFEDAGWARLGHVFSLAVSGRIADREVPLPESAMPVTTPRREFIYAVAIRCASFERLRVELMDGVDRLIRQALPNLALLQGEASDARFRLRLGDGAGPSRVIRPGESDPEWWYFSPHEAMEDLRAAASPGDELGAAAAHLLHQWGNRQPARRHQRHAIEGGLGVAQHWDEVVAFLSGGGDPVLVVGLEDASRDGCGVRASPGTAIDARVGDLLGLRPEEGGQWQLSVVRRIERKKDHSLLLGIETLTRTPAVMEADDGRVAARGVLCDPVRPGGTVRFLIPAKSFRQGSSIFLKVGANVLKLKPKGAANRGPACELRSFQIL